MRKLALFMTAAALAILALVAGQHPVPLAAAALATQSSGADVVYTDDGRSCVRDVFTFMGAGGGGGDDPLPLFNPNAGENSFIVRKLSHPNVSQVAYIPSVGRSMVTLGDAVIRVWDPTTGNKKAELRRASPILRMAASSGRPLVAGIDERGQVWLWDLSRSTIPEPVKLATLAFDPRENSFFPPQLALSADGRFLAVAKSRFSAVSSSEEQGWAVVSIYDVVSRRKLHSLEGSLVSQYIPNDYGASTPARMADGHAYPVASMEFSPNSQALLTSAYDGTMRLWSTATGQHLRCYELVDGEGTRTPIAFSPDGREIASASVNDHWFAPTLNKANIVLWNALTGQVVRRFTIPEAYADLLREPGVAFPSPELVFRPDGAAVALSFRREARVWAKQTGQLLAVIRSRPDATLQSLAYSPDSRHLVLAEDGPNGDDKVLIAVADHSVTRQAARATVYVEEGLQRGLQGNIPAMVQALIEAEQIDPFDQIYSAKVFAMAAYVAKAASWGSEDSSSYEQFLAAIPGAARKMTLTHHEWNGICWFGSLATQSSLFLNYCDKAVATAGTDADRANSRDSRAVARMFAGNYDGAIEDWAYFASYISSSHPDTARQRWEWIDALSVDSPIIYEFFPTAELWND